MPRATIIDELSQRSGPAIDDPIGQAPVHSPHTGDRDLLRDKTPVRHRHPAVLVTESPGRLDRYSACLDPQAIAAARRRRRRSLRAAWGVAACTAAVMAATGAAAADDGAVPLPPGKCPGLFVLGVAGTTESSTTADPFANTGMLGRVFGPLTRGVDVDHLTIPYAAAFGGAPGTGPNGETFAQSATDAQNRLSATAAEIAARCPSTEIGVVGFSQGAGVASAWARQVGAGHGPVDPNRIAGVATLSDWTRPPGAQTFPGRTGQMTPDPAPGTDGAAVSAIRLAPVPDSGGIDPDATGFGQLAGRVGEFCSPGDLSCDAPEHAAALRTAAELAAQSNLSNPITAVQSLGAAWATTAAKASTQVVLDDVQIDNGQVNYHPGQTVSERVAEAADPRTPAPTAQQTRLASGKLDRAAAAIAGDPLRQIPALAAQVGAAIGANVAANSDIVNPAVLARYAGVVTDHTGYGTDGAAQQAGNWFAAISHDLASGPRR
ncbi:cutinase family protein [Nocardia alni]|uniref:cutinase family protein n=1 Tax=Nocardia alni TaxID=2815723 RepID=UPI001C2152BA|nr:cutinase family protein [Nocardia alni]